MYSSKAPNLREFSGMNPILPTSSSREDSSPIYANMGAPVGAPRQCLKFTTYLCWKVV